MSNAPPDRSYWINVATRLAEPMLSAMSRGQLKSTMPFECQPGCEEDRNRFQHLEALGRLLCGIAPWLETGDGDNAERQACDRFGELARQSIAHGVDPQSPDFLNFTAGHQPLVDAAFLAHALLRAPRQLWDPLSDRTRQQLCDALRATRSRKPGANNWLLFSAMIEAALCRCGQDWDRMRVDYAIRQHEQWYKGDGVYGDGPNFHWDYYNSFVIQPMLIDILETVSQTTDEWDEFRRPVLKRAQRFAAVLERLISPEGTLPPIGRSLAYRFGALQLLGQIALRKELTAEISPAQVRCGMTAVIRRMIKAPGTFDVGGWLTIGLCGHQKSIGEGYIGTGSLYLCSAGLLPLGLAASDEFWSAPDEDWTARKIYAGREVPADHAL